MVFIWVGMIRLNHISKTILSPKTREVHPVTVMTVEDLRSVNFGFSHPLKE